MSGKVILVCGSRSWTDHDTVYRTLERLAPAMVVQGGCWGADLVAHHEARKLGIHSATVEALWERGKGAGPRRNRAMLALKPDLVLAFWDGESPGTRDMLDRASAAGVPTEVVRP